MNERDERGFALPVALMALVVVGVLVTGGFYMARQETRIGIASQNASQAFYTAEQGMNEILADWSAAEYSRIPLWEDTTVTDSLDWGVATVTITHMTDYMYFLNAEGEITRGGSILGGATRHIGLVTKIATVNIDPPAALTTRGPTTIKGSAEVHGEDTDPATWDASTCPNNPEDKPGIVSDDSSQVSTGGKGNVSGDPAVDEDSTINDSTFLDYGELMWDDLVELAKSDGKDVTGLGTNINSTGPVVNASLDCVTSDLLNWGDPLNPTMPCGSYFPLIYHGGPTLRIQSGGVGQGILLVDGTLDLRGNFVFYGIIIVQGTFETQGSGNRVLGGVMASNASFDSQSLVGGSVVNNSTCAVDQAILNNASLAKARPIAERSWVDLSSIGWY